LDNGRNAIDPIRMFKYLLLKAICELSDVDIVERSKYDMSFKYFLGIAPEDPVIDASSLTKFRKLRLKDLNLLDMLVNKTVEIAIEKGIIQSKAIIVDATHTKARYNQKFPREILQDRSRKLRKVVYKVDGSQKTLFPAKNTSDIRFNRTYPIPHSVSVPSFYGLIRQTAADRPHRNFTSPHTDRPPPLPATVCERSDCGWTEVSLSLRMFHLKCNRHLSLHGY